MKKKTIIIAEAGVNHNGSLKLAKDLIVAASRAKADYVKFQTFEPENMIRQNARLANYQKKNLKKNFTQYEMLKKYQLNQKHYKILINFAKLKKIKFISSPFDIQSVNFLNKFNLDYLKIPSGEINNYPYLKKIGNLNKKIILSTGASNLEEIKNAINILTKFGTFKKNITLLHCHSDYPSKSSNLNLKAIITMKKKFGLDVGYSDHSLGIEAPILAIAFGATIIEKHITLDKKLSGPDHLASMEPIEFKKMVKSIRISEKMLGDGKKVPTSNELKNKILIRKSLVANKKILKGEVFTEYNITTKRPGNGKSPMLYQKILKKKASKNYDIDDYI